MQIRFRIAPKRRFCDGGGGAAAAAFIWGSKQQRQIFEIARYKGWPTPTDGRKDYYTTGSFVYLRGTNKNIGSCLSSLPPS